MGYEVHVTRAEDWVDSEAMPIGLQEWLDYVEVEPEMRLDGHADTELGEGEVLRYESPGLAVWTAYSGHGRNGNMAWFDYREGRIVVKNPDDEILQKMLQIARDLSAHVVGDDGEHYEDGPPSDAGDAEPGPETADDPSRPWWKRIF